LYQGKHLVQKSPNLKSTPKTNPILEAEHIATPEQEEQRVEEPSTLNGAKNLDVENQSRQSTAVSRKDEEVDVRQQLTTESADSSEDDDEDDILARRTKGPSDGKFLGWRENFRSLIVS
jgi:hypothetical protein